MFQPLELDGKLDGNLLENLATLTNKNCTFSEPSAVIGVAMKGADDKPTVNKVADFAHMGP